MASGDWAARVAQYLKLGVKDTTERGELLAAIGGAVESAMERKTGLTFDKTTFRELYDGGGRDTLFLRHAPVLSVSSLSVLGSTITVGSLDGDAAVWPPPACLLDGASAKLTLNGGAFPFGANTFVVYDAGFDVLPADLVQAGVDWAAAIFKDRDRVGLSNENVGGQSFGITHDIPKRVNDALLRWKRTFIP
jgi:hypothetical protein